MPTFVSSQILPRPVEEVFAFFRDPANLVRVSPPELYLELLEGPPQLEMGCRLVLRVSRLGIPQKIVSEITALEPNVSFTDTQREGPFGKWIHNHHFESAGEGTQVRDVIEYEAPGGLLGFFLTAQMIERDLTSAFDYRQRRLLELLGK